MRTHNVSVYGELMKIIFQLSSNTYFICSIVSLWGKMTMKNEPSHDKTNKMACAPSEDSDQPGYPPSLIRVFAIRMKKTWVLSYPLSAQRRPRLDWADAQADLILCWAHSHFVGFVMRRLKYLTSSQSSAIIAFIAFNTKWEPENTWIDWCWCNLDRVKRIWYLSPMRAAKDQASLRIRAVSPEPPLLAHKSSESRGTFRQNARSLAPLNAWACAVKICHDGMLEDTNSLDRAHLI